MTPLSTSAEGRQCGSPIARPLAPATPVLAAAAIAAVPSGSRLGRPFSPRADRMPRPPPASLSPCRVRGKRLARQHLARRPSLRGNVAQAGFQFDGPEVDRVLAKRVERLTGCPTQEAWRAPSSSPGWAPGPDSPSTWAEVVSCCAWAPATATAERNTNGRVRRVLIINQ